MALDRHWFRELKDEGDIALAEMAMNEVSFEQRFDPAGCSWDRPQ
jgi:hypothetical protein